MNALIDAAFSRRRTVLLLLLLVLSAGAASYTAIPKESSPDIPIPMIYVSVSYQGIAPEDAERLLVRPLETELQSLEGLDELKATAAEGYAEVALEFDAGFNAVAALERVRQAVDRAEPNLPAGAEEPVVREVNVALFPILTAVLSGSVPERTLVGIAEDLEDRIEALAGVLEVEIGGHRDEVLEVLVDPAALESYGISSEALMTHVQRNNRLIAAGAIDTGAGRLTLKVPGVIETLDDVLSLPVKVEGATVVTLSDIAVVRRTFEDPEGFARIAGQPAVSLEVKKRLGANILETVAQVRRVIDGASADWPKQLDVVLFQDKSEQIETMLGDLENNVLSAILLVMLVIIATLGWRSALLVGLAIPGSFLAGIAVLYMLGYTLNIVVLFSLILVVGMLVDGAIVTAEFADRRMAEGLAPRGACAAAAKRMAWPVIASTATTLAVFVPLLFWSGTAGEFMKFLPITVIITLIASLAMALIFIPVLGGMVHRRSESTFRQIENIAASESGDLDRIGGGTGRYLRLLRALLRRPGTVLIAAFGILVASFWAHGNYGRGVEFFPEVEPEAAQLQVKSRDNLSIWEKDALVRRVEERLFGIEGIEYVYSRTIGRVRGASELAADVIGVVQLDFEDWDERRPAAAILDEARERLASIPGIAVQVREQQRGPASGRPVQIQVSAADRALLDRAADRIRTAMERLGGFVDVEDTRSLPGVEWRLIVDRERAAHYGADVALLGQAVQMTTSGLAIAEYRPDYAEDEVKIRVRFPAAERTLERVEQLRVPTNAGLIPTSNFVTLEPAPRTGTIERIDGSRVVTVSSDVAEGLLAAEKIAELQAALVDIEFPQGVEVAFGGQDEDQREAMSFLSVAFLAALFLMLVVLVTQFNSVYQAVLVLSAIVFSTAGVFLGLLVTGRPFGIVMGGIGVIALAGIVVNNNIVLIDAYNEIRAKGAGAAEAALRSGAQRLRPVMLTTVTTVLGLLPMMLAMNIDFIGREITFGAPSTQFWVDLSTAIGGGLSFATVLTLVLTPCMLVLGAGLSERIARRRGGTLELREK